MDTILAKLMVVQKNYVEVTQPDIEVTIDSSAIGDFLYGVVEAFMQNSTAPVGDWFKDKLLGDMRIEKPINQVAYYCLVKSKTVTKPLNGKNRFWIEAS